LRSLLFGFIGYNGLAAYQAVLGRLNALETAGTIILILLVLAFLVWFYSLRKSGGIHAWIKKHFGEKGGV